jgi:succinate dehydrogenase / fumarate reductase cytochrome b subunit
MTTRRSPLRSLITTKLIIGVTGILLFAYLILHIAGNLMVFLGRDAFNSYSHALISNPLVVPVEIGLLVVFLIHLFKAVRMTFQNQSARPVKYATKTWAGGASQKSLASSSMILTGLAILIFVPIHVKTFKYGAFYDVGGGVRDLYRMEAENFNSPLAVAFYVVMMVVVGLHLWHGVASSFSPSV